MGYALLLYIEDANVGPGIELIRKIAQPDSNGKPHITVRFSTRGLSGNARSLYKDKVSHLLVVEPGEFGLSTPSTNGKVTVFLRCESDELEAVAHKPQYPDSVFHITVYDGHDREFALALLDLLRAFPWGFDVALGRDSHISEIPVGKHKSLSRKQVFGLSSGAQAYLQELFSGGHSRIETWASLAQQDRMTMIAKICQKIHRADNIVQVSSFQPVVQPLAPLIQAEEPSQLLLIDDQVLEHSPDFSEIHERDVSAPPRSRVGFYLTPPELALDAIRFALSQFPEGKLVRFGDPAVGTGVFYGMLVRELGSNMIEDAIGIEVNDDRALQTCRRWGRSGLTVRSGDFLTSEMPTMRNLIIANPPYTRYQNINRQDRKVWQARIKENLGIDVSGLSSLYVYFILLAHQWLESDGIAAWLIPAEFLKSTYGRALRHYLATRVQTIRVHVYSENCNYFETALVSSCLVVFRKCEPSADHKIEFSWGSAVAGQEPSLLYNSVRASELNSWTPEGLNPSVQSELRIGDIFEVKRGIATGANNKFVLTRAQCESLQIDPKLLRPVLPKARYIKAPIIMADSNGNPAVEPELYLIDLDMTWEEICARSAGLVGYLESIREQVCERRLVKSREIWYKQEKREPSPFLFSYMGRENGTKGSLRFYWNKSRAVVLNTYHMLYFKPAVSALMIKNGLTEQDVFEEIRDLGGTSIISNGKKYGGGLHKFEPSNLKQMYVKSALLERLLAQTGQKA